MKNKFLSLILFLVFGLVSNAQIISTYDSIGLNDPAYLSFDSNGNLLISETLSHKILKLDTLGVLTIVAGNGTAGFTGDSGLATAALINEPLGITVDSMNNIYFVDGLNYRIRKINSLTNIITTIAGNGTIVSSGDSGLASAANLYYPGNICFDTAGNIYIAEFNRIRKINTLGFIYTIAGNGMHGHSGDGGLAISSITSPNDICIDKMGNLYIAENTHTIRKINTAGIISTIAGDTSSFYYNGDGILATNAHLDAACVKTDNNGLVYISDEYNNRIRVVDTVNIIHTIAGNGIGGFSGDGGLGNLAEIHNPGTLAFDFCNNFYFGDIDNARIRKVIFDTTCNLSSVQVKNIVPKGNLSLYPNPAYSTLTIQASEKIGNIAITNMMGQSILIKEYKNEDKVEVDIGNLQAGVYFVRVNERWERFVKE